MCAEPRPALAAAPDIDLSTLLRPNYRGLKQSLTFPFKLAGVLRELAGQPRRGLGRRFGQWPAARCPRACTRAAGSSATSRRCSPTPTARTSSGCSSGSLLPGRHRSRHHRAGDREGEYDVLIPLRGGRRLGGAARNLRAGRDQRPRVHRRRHRLDHERRRRDRARCPVRRRHQSAVPYINDFAKNILDDPPGSRAQRVSDMGIAAIANQTFRLLSHDRLHRAVEIWESATSASTSSRPTRAR